MSPVLIILAAAAALVMVLIFCVPLAWIWTSHRRKMEEIRLRHKVAIAEETRAAIEAIRKEVASLRDTTTEYDVSFDTALHRLESRMGNMEQRVLRIERSQESESFQARQGVGGAV
jgi:hypothetical protein